MKQSKINLLVTKENYRKIERYFFFVRIATFIILISFVIVSSFFFINSQIQNNALNLLLTQKKVLLNAIKNRSEDEAKIAYIQTKYQDLKEFSKDDTYSYPYYGLLNNALASGTQSATLKSFQISKNREVLFIIASENIPGLLDFLRFAESQQFLKNFTNLTLKSFNALGANSKGKENYELSFSGKFIALP